MNGKLDGADSPLIEVGRSNQPFVQPEPQQQLCAQLQTFLTPVSAPVTGRLISPMDRAYLSDNLDSPLLIILRPGQTSVQAKEIAD